MSTLIVRHGFSKKMHQSLEDLGQQVPDGLPLTITRLKEIEEHLHAAGIQPFDTEHSYAYRAWIHPVTLYDLISDNTHNGLIDIFINQVPGAQPGEKYTFISNTEFQQTTALSGASVFFGSNSNLLDLKDFFVEK